MTDTFDGIKAGLEDALAFAKGDRARGRAVLGEQPSKPNDAAAPAPFKGGQEAPKSR